MFPSGSATAQLIGVLHGVKQGSSSGAADRGNGGVRKRREAREVRGYQSVASSAGNEAREGADEAEIKIDEKGWRALLNSFTISAVYTVGLFFSLLLSLFSQTTFRLIFAFQFVHSSYCHWLFPSFMPSQYSTSSATWHTTGFGGLLLVSRISVRESLWDFLQQPL